MTSNVIKCHIGPPLCYHLSSIFIYLLIIETLNNVGFDETDMKKNSIIMAFKILNNQFRKKIITKICETWQKNLFVDFNM